jgi:hypothetical protein
MKGLLMFALAVAAGLLLGPASTLAHHGTTAYDFSKTLILKGAITRFDWVKTENGGVEHWVAELTSPGMLTRSGWHHDSVKVGDEVTVYLHPSKNGTKFGLFQRAVFADGRQDLIDPRAP